MRPDSMAFPLITNLIIVITLTLINNVDLIGGRNTARTYSKSDLIKLKNEVYEMFHHAYQGYLDHAYPYDELRPLTCSGMNTWGSYSLTLIDSLDTLAVMGNHSEFRRVYHLLTSSRDNFDSDINVSVFETNIRIVGGLLGAHLQAKRAGVDVGPAWPCEGPLLTLAEDAATRLLPAFDTATGMPYGTVNLRYGVPSGETSITCTASVGTFIVEFGTLSRLTGNPIFEETALRAIKSLWSHRSSVGLVGNHIDVESGKWTATDAGIGAGVDSFFEYLVKGAALLQRPELMKMFKELRSSIELYLNHDDWYFWATMKQGSVTMPLFQSLEAFWPGLLSLVGDTMPAMKTMHNYQQVLKQYGFLPEFYNVPQRGATDNREGYPLRPELIESAMYLYRSTKDPFLITIGEDMLRSIQHSTRTPCGYATVKNVVDHTLEDRMESFFLAETTKYLYLLFDEDNFIHNPGNEGEIINTKHGECIIDAGGYIFNTEAHPVDPAALQCCSSHTIDEIEKKLEEGLPGMMENPSALQDLIGQSVPARIKEIQDQRMMELEKKRRGEEEFERRMQEIRMKDRESVRRHLQEKNSSAATTEEVAAPPPPPVEEAATATPGPVKNQNAPSILIEEPQEDEGQSPVRTSGFLAEKFSKVVEKYLSMTGDQKSQFQIDKFQEDLIKDQRFMLNGSWYSDFSILTCPARHFLERFSTQGEFFEHYDL